MSEQPLFLSHDHGRRWSTGQTLEAISKREGETLQRGSFIYTVQRINESMIELHTYKAIDLGDGGTNAGIRGYVLVCHTPDMVDGPVLARPFVIIPPGGDGYVSDPESDKGIPVTIDTGFSDIEGPLDALEALLMDDDFIEGVGALDWDLGKTTHGHVLS